MKIKYDKRMITVLWITAGVSLAFFLVALVVMYLEIAGMELVFLFGVYVGGGVLIYALINLVFATCYCKRLRRHGYIVPDDRMQYDNHLENLPRTGVVGQDIDLTGQDSRESIRLAVMHLVVFVDANIWNLYYYIHWHRYVKDTAVIFLWVQIFLDLVWGISALGYFRQRNPQTFRDDVEMDITRKKRTSMEEGVLAGIVVLSLTILVKIMAVEMTAAIYRSLQETALL